MPDLLEAVENGVAWLTLNRPERLNALSPEMTGSLSEALQRLATEREVGAIVITGAGRGWCSGGDVKTIENRGRDQSVEDRVEGLRRAHQLPLLMRNCPKVIIAAINGPVAGAGLGLALACDLRVAAKSARFGTAFVRIGYSGDYGGSWSLTRLVGTAKAREMYLLGDVIDAEEAARLGIVNRLVDDDKLRDEAMALARRVADGPRIALGYMKQNLNLAEGEAPPGIKDPRYAGTFTFFRHEHDDMGVTATFVALVAGLALAVTFAVGEADQRRVADAERSEALRQAYYARLAAAGS